MSHAWGIVKLIQIENKYWQYIPDTWKVYIYGDNEDNYNPLIFRQYAPIGIVNVHDDDARVWKTIKFNNYFPFEEKDLAENFEEINYGEP